MSWVTVVCVGMFETLYYRSEVAHEVLAKVVFEIGNGVHSGPVLNEIPQPSGLFANARIYHAINWEEEGVSFVFMLGYWLLRAVMLDGQVYCCGRPGRR